MSKWFNIGGPCNPTDHYMLSATARLPEVMSLVNRKQYFAVHAPRQCGKTTAFRALMDEINAKGEKSGYADVSGIGNGAIFSDFAPIISVKSGKTTVRKFLSLRANLWFDRKNDHAEGIGSAVFVP